MDPRHAQLLLMLISAANEAMRQVQLADLDALPPELKHKLLDERDANLKEWQRLAP